MLVCVDEPDSRMGMVAGTFKEVVSQVHSVKEDSVQPSTIGKNNPELYYLHE